MTDTGVIAIAENCKSLTSLDLIRDDQVTDVGVITLAENCKSLTSLSLGNCDQVTDIDIAIACEILPNCSIRKFQ